MVRVHAAFLGDGQSEAKGVPAMTMEHVERSRKMDSTVPATEPHLGEEEQSAPVCLGGPQEISPEPGAHKPAFLQGK